METNSFFQFESIIIVRGPSLDSKDGPRADRVKLRLAYSLALTSSLEKMVIPRGIEVHVRATVGGLHFLYPPSTHQTLNQCWFDVRPMSRAC